MNVIYKQDKKQLKPFVLFAEIPISYNREAVWGKNPHYLAKLSSEPGARGAATEEESENTSTSKLPLEEGAGAELVRGTAPRPRRSADGEGVDYKKTRTEYLKTAASTIKIRAIPNPLLKII